MLNLQGFSELPISRSSFTNSLQSDLPEILKRATSCKQEQSSMSKITSFFIALTILAPLAFAQSTQSNFLMDYNAIFKGVKWRSIRALFEVAAPTPAVVWLVIP